MNSSPASVQTAAPTVPTPMHATRLRSLQALGIFCGFAAGAWLGGAEAPIKLVNPEISPITVSLIMVFGVFLARWSVPAFVRGTSHVRDDVQQAPHLVVWAVLAGCMWAVANTLTIYAIRNVGLSIAFPLWNTNSLLGIFWGFLLFNELHYAGWKRWLGVLGGALCMFGGATLLAIASSHQAAPGKAALGIFAAFGAGILWGTMYIPYRKAYLTGMNPLSFITFFTVGELATMTVLAVGYRGATPLWHELVSARSVLFWLMLGGFVWVLGDLFQQYATKYVGISRGIPLSNTNQLWGLLWGILVFHELRGGTQTVYLQVAGGSLLMALGAVAIALSSATEREHSSWRDAADREGQRYGVEGEYVRAGMEGREMTGREMEGKPFAAGPSGRTFLDWLLILGATGIFAGLAVMARLPHMDIALGWAIALAIAMLALLATCGIALWRTTRFR
ncbi:MAG: GRP family sugar transporter [Candidatus Sulfotelmatobacter sp.]